ncbi:MAG: transpeptidase family protein [Spirochaeta sp.]|nr:transpeptidase family protein [Spirochaeta sp.]
MSRLRYRIVFALLGVFSLVLVYQYATVMLGSSPRRPASTSTTLPERGPILDRNGRVLALQTQLDTVAAWTPDLQDIEETSRLLAEILDTDGKDVRRRLDSSLSYVVLRRNLTPGQSDQIQQLRSEGFLRGISLRPDHGRSYPERELAAALLGYVGVDNVGLDGVEYSLNDVLSPRPGTSRFGDQVFLTIDVAVQAEAERIARQSRETHNADSTMLLVMDSNSGDILAYASSPSFDPNEFQRYTAEQRRNRPATRVYEPGSVFKVFSLASFMHLGGVGPQDQFQTSEGYSDDAESFLIRDLGNYGTINAEGIIKYSSNVGAAYAADTVDADSFYHMLRRFGFGERTGVELSGEERGLLRQPELWSGRSRQTISIGQEIGVTAMQIMAAAGALANKGVLVKPQIVKRIVSADGKIQYETEREPVRQVVSQSVADRMLDYMYSSTVDGTAQRIAVDGVKIAAKTGTAEVFDSEIGQYSDSAFVASTLAIFPKDAPQIVAYMVIDNPKEGEFYGGRIATTPLKELADYIVPYLGIPTEDDIILEHSGQVAISEPRMPKLGDTVPDFTGMPKRLLLPLYEREDISIEMSGNGWVVQQDPPAGTDITPQMTIRLVLE